MNFSSDGCALKPAAVLVFSGDSAMTLRGLAEGVVVPRLPLELFWDSVRGPSPIERGLS
jgi:hypothetical protein